MASIPAWFDESVYLANKLAQLKSVDPDTAWNEATLSAAIRSAGLSPYEHFVQFGAAEHVSPNADFNVAEYLAAKAAQMNANLKEGETPWTEASIAKAIKDAGMTEWSHYQQFGSAEGVNPSNAFDAAAYCAAKAAIMGGEWTAASIAKAIADAGMSVLEHYEMYKGTGTEEVAADAKYEVPSDNQVTPTKQFDPYQPEKEIPAGKTFTLTDKVDVFTGVAGGDDTVTGTFANLKGDAIADTSSADTDTLNLTGVTAQGLADSSAKYATVTGFEVVNLSSDSYSAVTVDAKYFAGAEQLNVTGTKGFTGLTVENAGKATVTAGTGVKGSLTVKGVTNGKVVANADTTTVKVEGSDATTDSVTIKLANDATVEAGSTKAIETVTLDVAAGKTVTYTGLPGAETVAVKGTGDVTLKVTSAKVTGDTVTKGNAGKLDVVVTDAVNASTDISKVAADSFNFAAAGTAGDITIANGQNVALAKAGTYSFKAAGAGTADVLNLTLSDTAAYTSLTADGSLENMAITATGKTAEITALKGMVDAGTTKYTNNVTMTATGDVTIGTMTDIDKFDGSAVTGKLNIGGTTAVLTGDIIGGTTNNTVAYNAIAANTAATFTGTGDSKDSLTVTSVAAQGAFTATLGAGDDSVNITGANSGTIGLSLGEGNDKVTIGTANASTGVLVINAEAGTNTIDLGTGDHVGTISITGGTGADTIKVGGDVSGADLRFEGLTSADSIVVTAAATFSAAQLSGKDYTFAKEGAGALTVKAAVADTTIDLSHLNVQVDKVAGLQKVTINGGDATGALNITGTAAADIITAGAAGGTIIGGKGADQITLNAATKSDILKLNAGDSLISAHDGVAAFAVANDKFDLTSLGLSSTKVAATTNAAITWGSSALTAESAAALAITVNSTDKFFGDNAVVFLASADTTAQGTAIFIDANNNGTWDADTDLVVVVAGVNATGGALADGMLTLTA